MDNKELFEPKFNKLIIYIEYCDGDNMFKGKLNRYRFGLAVLWMAGSLGLVGCKDVMSAKDDAYIKPVKFYQVPSNWNHGNLSFVAKVEAAQYATLAFQVPGEISDFNVKMGQEVQQGEVLVRIDPTDYELAVQARKASFDLSSASLVRANRLVKKPINQ